MSIKTKNNEKDYFDDEFEVIYEDDFSDILNENYQEQDSDAEPDYYDESDDPPSDSTGGRNPGRRQGKGSKASTGKKPARKRAEIAADNSRNKKKKTHRKAPNLISPLKKTAQTGGRAAYRMTQTVLRAATMLIIIAIMAYIGVSFWNGHSAYGNLNTAVAEKNYALAAYLGFAVLLLLIELITLFWAPSGQRIKDGRLIRKLDTGRGLFSFLFIYALCYLSGLFGSMIPDAPSALYGLKEAVMLYGSLNGTLFALCTAGVVSCLVRKFIFH